MLHGFLGTSKALWQIPKAELGIFKSFPHPQILSLSASKKPKYKGCKWCQTVRNLIPFIQSVNVKLQSHSNQIHFLYLTEMGESKFICAWLVH